MARAEMRDHAPRLSPLRGLGACVRAFRGLAPPATNRRPDGAFELGMGAMDFIVQDFDCARDYGPSSTSRRAGKSVRLAWPSPS